jgi:hypothetical protein
MEEEASHFQYDDAFQFAQWSTWQVLSNEHVPEIEPRMRVVKERC